MASTIPSLHRKIISCERCPRLVEWRTDVAQTKTKRFMDWEYWGKPVPGFGDPKAELLLVGLAPAAHGANRTGRMFTGDESGKWLYRALHKAGFADRPESFSRTDGMTLNNCYITAACRCAPPNNKPFPSELSNCRPFIVNEFLLLKHLRVVIGLGKVGFDAAFDSLREAKKTSLKIRPKFSHGTMIAVNDSLHLIGSYHPSQQNTFTGTLTRPMFDSIFTAAKRLL